uniref:Reverse transcriptase domain-containing protein n=1 Tax=Tanacetum cinerariifolium TaxID=118510 RepID=A0A6L2P1Y7_TANCI|nr:reverse transcriptase domain-containing protein [Tanacetum cinerariifolium]
MAAEGNGDPPVPDLRTMEELCQPSLNGRGGPIALIAIQETNFGLKNDMIQQVQILANFMVCRDTSAQRSESASSITFSSDTETALKAEMAKINKNLMRVLQVNQQVKAVTPSCETCGGPHSFSDCPATVGNTQNVYAAGAYQAYQAPAYQAPVYQAPVHQPQIPQPQAVTTNKFTNFMKANDAILKNMQTNMTSLTNSNLELKSMFSQFMKMNTASSLGSGTLPSNTITNPKEDLKGITTRSETAYSGPMIPTTSSSLVVERETEATKDMVHPTNNGSTKDIQPPVVLIESLILNSEPVISPIIEPVASPVSALKPNLKPSIPYPSRLHDQKLRDKVNDQQEKFFQIFKDLNFNISFVDALILMPKFGPSIKSLLTNKDKICELAKTPLNEHCSAVLLKKLPEKLGELTLRVGKKAITFNLDQTSRYSANYNDMTANRIDVIDMNCEEYSKEVLDFSDVIASGNPTTYYDPIVSTTSLTLTLFVNSDFLLEEVDAFLALEDGPTSPEVYQSYVDTEGDILLLEAFLNDDPSLPHLNQGNYLPEVRIFGSDDKLPVIVAKDLSAEEKTTLITVLKLHKRAIAWKLSDIKGIDPEFCTHKILMGEDFEPAVQHQRRVNPKIHDVIKQEVLKLHDDALIYSISDSRWDMPFELMCDARDFAIESNYTTTKKEMLAVVYAFKKFRSYLIMNKSIVYTDHSALKYLFAKKDSKARLIRWVLLFQEFTFKVIDIKGAENMATNYLSRLENPHQNVLDPKEINESFPIETLNMVSFRGNSSTPWFADFANYHARNFVVKGMSSQQKNKFFKDVKHYFWDDPFLFKSVLIKSSEDVYTARKPLTFSRLATMDPPGDIMAQITQPRRVLLYNSRLKIFFGKLKSRWSEPFTISHVFPYGTVKLSQPDGLNFKVNGHRLEHYFGEDVPKMVIPDLQTFPKDH